MIRLVFRFPLVSCGVSFPSFAGARQTGSPTTAVGVSVEQRLQQARRQQVATPTPKRAGFNSYAEDGAGGVKASLYGPIHATNVLQYVLPLSP